VQTQLENRENDINKAEANVRIIKQDNLRLERELSSCKNMFLTIEKAQEFNRVISELTDDKTKLETLYFKTRSDMSAYVNENIYLQTQATEKDKALRSW